MRDQKGFTVASLLGFIVVWLVLVSLTVFVVVHFIRKFW